MDLSLSVVVFAMSTNQAFAWRYANGVFAAKPSRWVRSTRRMTLSSFVQIFDDDMDTLDMIW